MEENWGYYGNKPPCIHLVELRNKLAELKLTIYSEHGTEPDGWVNVHCQECRRTYETVLCDDSGDPLTPLA